MIHSFLSIFKESSNSFEGQQEGERVVFLLRQHPFTILLRIAFFCLACLLPIASGILFSSAIVSGGWLDLFLFTSSVWYLFLWLAIFYALTMYTLNTVTITDRCIIESDQYGLFSRGISELHSHRVQDVSSKTKGIIETFLKFGDITVQTAGSEKEFVFHKIAHPDKVKDVIMQIAATRDSGIKTTL